ncbi:RNA-directed DNA polymerase, eukaryota, reverse transcriptase zinc-binding domain protein, partial [Tanacetum coccineum]
MIHYFKEKWEDDRQKEKSSYEENLEDVMENADQTDLNWLADDVRGVIETHVKVQKIDNIARRVILIGWDKDLVNVMVLHCLKQAVLCQIERDLKAAKTIINDHPWMLAGDFNVTLKVEEHSAGGSNMTSDIVMINEGFTSMFGMAHGHFLPFVTSDHSAAMISFPSSILKKFKAFRFANYIVDKENFKSTVKKGWDLEVNGCNMFRVVKKLKALKSPMNKLNWKMGTYVRMKEAECLAKYMEAIIDEEKLLFQRAKIDWLKNGDKTSFLGTVDNVNPIFDAESLFSNKLEENEAMEMISEVTDLEIKNAVFDIGDAKAPRPDGFTFKFFKNTWKIVGKDVCSAMRDFFNNGKLLGEVNATLISLVPKVTQPVKISEFRPIACCNVLYKCISKILTNRIKPGLNKLVNQNQSSFVPGRLIQDNLLLSQELLKGYNCKNGPKRCALKVDIAKAYDTVNWGFLENILNQFGFHEKMNPNFKFHKGCKELRITHLSFANDLLVMSHGDNVSVSIINDALNEFSDSSGLKPNMRKSTIFFRSVDAGEKLRILDILPFKIGKLPVKYLGIPLLSKKVGINDCKILVERVRNKVNDWKNKALSYAGRLQFIASVLSAIEGVLGLKLLDKCNEVLLIKHIWKLVSNQEGLWVKWVNRVKLKREKFLEVSTDYNDSGTWKALLDMRDKVRPYIVNDLGDGFETSMWHDNWNVVGPLSKVINSRCLYDARLSNACTVKDMIEDNGWVWPSEWQNQFPILNQVVVPSLHNGRSDMVKWKSKSGKRMVFSVNEAWKDLKDELPCVNWWKCVLFSQCNPSKSNDSHNHLFFKCEFSAPIWDATKRKMNAANATNEWDQIVQTMGVFGIEYSMGVIEMVGSQVVWDDAFYGCHCLPILTVDDAFLGCLGNGLSVRFLSCYYPALGWLQLMYLIGKCSGMKEEKVENREVATTATMAIKLHGVIGSPSVFRAMAALYEKDLDFEFVAVDFVAREHKLPQFLALNPFGELPAFEDGDLILF